MFKISKIIGKLVKDYVLSTIERDRDCRLLLPGLTPCISRELHQYLKDKLPPNVGSYLIIGEGEQPSEEEGKIKPVGLTSKRIGSFVAVTNPGQLVHIQDSIRGSGGTIRSIAYSEEWPWIDDVGSESFRFDGPILNTLVKEWSQDPDDQEWLREFTLSGLLENTRSSSHRMQVFLEEIIGNFNPADYPSIFNVREKYLCHVGVPRPSGEIPIPKTLISDSNRLCKRIIERYQGEEGSRNYARYKIGELFEGEERQIVIAAIDYLLDKLGTSETIDTSLLAFHRCFQNANDWNRLNSRLLEDIFNVKPNATEIDYEPRVSRGIVSANKKKVATFKGEVIEIEIYFKNIPYNQVTNNSWTARILSRQNNLVDPVIITESQGSVVLKLDTSNISQSAKQIPLRVALAQDNEIKLEQRLYLHLCGENRTAFVVVEENFNVIDAKQNISEDDSGNKVVVKEPVIVFLLSNNPSDPKVNDENNERVELIQDKGTWKPTRPLNVYEKPSGQATWRFDFNGLSAVISFEGGDIIKGEFTLEDELRSFLSNPGTSESHIKKVLSYFIKPAEDFYPALGGIGEHSMHRLFLSRVVTTPTGWQPVLANLMEKDYEISGSLGDFIKYLGQIDDDDFDRLVMPDEALKLLTTYSQTRESVRAETMNYCNLDGSSSEHPIYATHPIYLHERCHEMEKLLHDYLEAYSKIIDYVHDNKDDLTWHQLFILIYLDCIVNWDGNRERNMFFLLGPWHPLVVAKRFMVQNSLVSRGLRFVEDGSSGKEFRHLCALLGRIQGFRWVMDLSTRDKTIEPAFVSTTSDPGWHVAFKINRPSLSQGAENTGFEMISRALYDNLGLVTETTMGGTQHLPSLILSNYMNCYPSRRSIGIRVCRGYNNNEVVKKLDSFLHAEDEPTEKGLELPGGVRLYLQDSSPDEIDPQWTKPQFFLYTYEDDEECIREHNPDIFMSQPPSDVSFRNGAKFYDLPRGKGLQSVFYEPLRWLTEGPSHVPDSVTYEFDTQIATSYDLGAVFIGVLGRLQSFVGYPQEKISSVPLPNHLNAPWVVIPGQALDPAILVKYVCNSASRSPIERALWDYKVGLSGHMSSFYILSTIPRSFQVTVNGFFHEEDIASEFILELGKIGIAIGGEALKTGRRALGIIGLVGAVRLLAGDYLSGSPISHHEGQVGFLIPVDSFESFFGKINTSSAKRSDILALKIVLPTSDSPKMCIFACGVESKFVSGTFSRDRVKGALEQGKSTTQDFRKLVMTSLGTKAMPERLALLELIKFGLRISSQSMHQESESRVEVEREIFWCILQGNYEYLNATHEAILVSTEADLPGQAEHVVLEEGLWIRLTKTCWPGIGDSSQFNNISQELANLFASSETPIDYTPITKISSKKQDPIQENEQEPVNQYEDQNEEGDISGTDMVEPELKNQKNLPLQKIFIGVDESRVAKYYDPQSPVDPLDNINMMVTGSSGKGKTQFLRYLICKFREQGKNVLILDFKNDFANDEEFTTRAQLDRIFVNFEGLPYNPLIPYPVRHPATQELFIQPGQHIAGVTSVFRRTFRLGDQQAASLKGAMASAFKEVGLDATGTIPYIDDNHFPDFSHVGQKLKDQNERAFNRLEPLFSLGIFKPELKNSSFHELTGRSMVIDLSMIPSEEIKNALAQLVVMSAHAYFNSIPHSGIIRQLFVIDEAFRVLDYESMADFVLQCRAYGVGMLLSSQYPSQFPIDVSSSLATKIIHGNDRDSSRIRDIVQLIRCEGREGDIAGLERFQAFMDNRHYPHTLIRTMNYPLYLVWSKLQELGSTTRDGLINIEGFNPTMLPINNLIQLLTRMGLAEEIDGEIKVINRI